MLSILVYPGHASSVVVLGCLPGLAVGLVAGGLLAGLAFFSVFRVDDFDVFLVTWSLTCPFTCPFLHLYFLCLLLISLLLGRAFTNKLFSLVLCCQVEKKQAVPSLFAPRGLEPRLCFSYHHSFCFYDCYSGFLSPFSLTSFQDP